jgi:hypothetical protein
LPKILYDLTHKQTKPQNSPYNHPLTESPDSPNRPWGLSEWIIGLLMGLLIAKYLS